MLRSARDCGTCMFTKYIPLRVFNMLCRLSTLIGVYILCKLFSHLLQPGEPRSHAAHDTWLVFFALVWVLLLYLADLNHYWFGMLAEGLKANFQTDQGVAMVREIFGFSFQVMTCTPIVEFGQLVYKIYTNLDALVPALTFSCIPIQWRLLSRLC